MASRRLTLFATSKCLTVRSGVRQPARAKYVLWGFAPPLVWRALKSARDGLRARLTPTRPPAPLPRAMGRGLRPPCLSRNYWRFMLVDQPSGLRRWDDTVESARSADRSGQVGAWLREFLLSCPHHGALARRLRVSRAT